MVAPPLPMPRAEHAIVQAWARRSFNVYDLRCKRMSPHRVSCTDTVQFPGVHAGHGTDVVTLCGRRVTVTLGRHR